MTTYDIYKTVIEGGSFVLSDIEEKLEASYIEGKITFAEKIELSGLAADRADDFRQIDIVTMLADLDQRISALESKGVRVWTSGMITERGQTVLYDVDSDGVLDYCRYDGGRASTASRPGNIEGWVKTDPNGTPTHTISKDDNGNIVLTPIEETGT